MNPLVKMHHFALFLTSRRNAIFVIPQKYPPEIRISIQFKIYPLRGFP
jgi:hypothetical protein